MSEAKAARLLPWTGPLFAIMFVVFGGVLSGNTPGEKASAEKVMAYYNSHQGRTAIGDFAAPLAAVLLMLFYSHLRTLARERGNAGVGPTVMLGGAIIFSSGLLLSCSIDFALLTSSDHNQAQIAQTMNVLQNSTWLPFIGGIAVALIGAGMTVLKSKILPTWIGWVALVVGIVSLAGPGGFIGFFGFPLFGLVAGIILGVRKTEASAAAAV